MTIEEALFQTMEMLKNVSVPIGLYREIGEPVAAAVNNLKECLAAIAEQKEKTKDAENE